MRAALLVVGLVACTSKPAPTVCSPTGEKCSPLAPYGLGFEGPVIHRELAYYARLALGGTASFTLVVSDKPESGEINSHPLDAPYTASIDTASIELAQSGNVVTLHALANSGDRLPPGVDATLQIRDSDGLLIGQMAVGTAPITDVTYGISTFEQYNRDGDPVFAAGGPVVIELWDDAEHPLWDESMRVTGASQLAWDLIAAPPATSTVTVAPGSIAPVGLTIPVATDVTITQLAGGSYVSSGAPVTLCFEARSGGHQVFGATWTYTVNGVAPLPPDAKVNCIVVSADPMVTTMTIVVSAAGASLTVMLPVI